MGSFTLNSLRQHYDWYLSPAACESGRAGTGREHMTDLDQAAVAVAELPREQWLEQPAVVSRYIKQALANELDRLGVPLDVSALDA